MLTEDNNNLTNRRKVTFRQGVFYPRRQHPISGRQGIKTTEIKGDDQRRNVRRRSKEQIKGNDQRRNVKRRSKEQIRAATKKPVIRGPTQIKNQQES
jgi:hypothetical protein